MVSDDGMTTPDEHGRPSSWGGAEAWNLLRRIAVDARRRHGFRVAGVEVLRGDGLLELVAFTGRSDYEAVGTGTSFSRVHVEQVLELGTRYGRFVFLPEEDMDPDLQVAVGGYGYVPEIPESSDPDAWRPLDMLVGHVVDQTGSTRALLHLDDPVTGRRPPAGELQEIAESLEVSLLAILAIVDREELTRRSRLDELSRAVVRASSGHAGSTDLITLVHPDLVVGFRALSVEVLLLDGDVFAPGPGIVAEWADEVRTAVEEASRRAWDRETLVVVDRDRVWGDDELDRAHHRDLAGHLVDHAAHELLLVPVGSGGEPIGVLVVVRDSAADRWTIGEGHGAVAVGHDLGRALLSARAYEREVQLVEQLRRVDDHRRQLVATISHELKTPLAAILGHVDLLHDDGTLGPDANTSLDVLDRSTSRLVSLVDNLLMLSRLESADTPPVDEVVELGGLLDEVMLDEAALAALGGVTLHRTTRGSGMTVAGDREELRRLMANLISNAVKYARAGGTVRVSLAAHDGHVVFSCADDGIGISAEDQLRLSEEFFRSTNPDAVRRAGTGLGLAIVRRILSRCGGRLEVESELDSGTTMTVILPAAGDAPTAAGATAGS
ncbi:sensor histidine kinase [Nocardioides baculatus]|uniref:histidine kinase n=1 Tax=Nocardioides baculatus TaxID=2801337 RepID=A0ABS1LE29_9ACTN|nr:HAMP domain-containing sensor histidine kinase [Nocardioides baculatus]MBL0749623.1 hypothetical protein [Nocardioides baculatus]